MSHSQSVTADVMPLFTARQAWRMPAFVTVSLLLHLALIVGFLRNDNVPALLMAGAEGGVVAMTMVSVASHQLPAAPTAKPLAEPAPQEKTATELPSRAIKMPALAQPDAVIKLPAANEKTRESAPRKVQKPQQKKPQQQAPTVRRSERQSPPQGQAIKPVQAPAEITTPHPGEAAVQSDMATGAASSVSAVRTGSSDSGRAQTGAGSSATQNVKALHRRVNYPQRAKAMGVEGRVRVKFNITASGTITDVRILSETPTGVFAAAITKDMSRWRYQTQAEVNDQTVTIVFKLNGQIDLEN